MGKIIDFTAASNKHRQEANAPRRCVHCGSFSVERFDENDYSIAVGAVTGDGELGEFDDWVYSCRDCGKITIVIWTKEFTDFFTEYMKGREGNVETVC